MTSRNLDSVDTKVLLDGTPLNYESIRLDQYMGKHHTFAIAVNYRHEAKTVWAVTVDEIFRQKLGKPLIISMSHLQSGATNEFEGVVTDVEVVGIDGDQGTVILYGGSPTILLDRNPGMGSYVDYTLHNIVKDTLDGTGIDIEVENSPKLEYQIPYVARYKESSFAFLSRILYSYGEWFYYDGKKLIVGNPHSAELETNEVTFDVELSKVCSRAGIRNLNNQYYDYNATESIYFEEASLDITRASFPTKASKQASDPLYPTASKLPIDRAVMGDQDMSRTVRVNQSRNYMGTAEFTATCKTCAIKVGRETVVYLPETFKDTFFKDLGSFLVLEVHHTIEAPGKYQNTFKGITINTETLPDDHIVTPMAFPEPAVVVANDDPRNQGRVKVRYMWQSYDESTNWIRVQTPDAGSSGAVPRNRGFVFIPEVDDQVMVGFQNGHPERPFVMGSLFHRDVSKGAAADNNIKTISTKSGHIIEFNDDEGGEWGIKITDRKNNIIHIDTQDDSIEVLANKNVTITAGDTMTLNAKTLNINVGEDMTTSVGKDQTTSVGGTVDNSENELKETVSQNATIEIGGNLSEKTGDTKMTSDADFIVKCEGKALVQGAQDARISKG